MAKIVFISDTHNQHNQINVGSGDILIHAGDATGTGQARELESFAEWFAQQDFQHKIYVPGNHEIGLEKHYNERIKWFKDRDIIILNDESTTLEGVSLDNFLEYQINVHGSPITPNFGSWAFMRARGDEIKKHWDKIPDDTDILITHGPPHGIRDMTNNPFSAGYNCGCEELLEAVYRVKPKIHVFGHIHEGAGTSIIDGVEFINAAQVDWKNHLTHKPIERTLLKKASE